MNWLVDGVPAPSRPGRDHGRLLAVSEAYAPRSATVTCVPEHDGAHYDTDGSDDHAPNLAIGKTLYRGLHGLAKRRKRRDPAGLAERGLVTSRV